MPLPAHMAVRVIIIETATAKEHSFKLYYKSLDPGSPPTAETIQEHANDFKVAFNTALPPVFTTAHQFNGVEVVYNAGGTQLDARSNAAAAAGTQAGLTAPEEVAVLIQRRTGLAGRDKRGRVFLPCVPISFLVGSAISTAGMTAYDAVADMLVSNVTAGPDEVNYQPQTPSFKTSQLHPLMQARVYSEAVSRRDRRFIKRGFVIGGNILNIP